MRHSELLLSSGTTLQIMDPATGMYLDVSFLPGQTHHALRVLMNGQHFVAHLRLVKIETTEEQDLAVMLRVPGSPSDAPPERGAREPHPATVLKPQERTRAGVEGSRVSPASQSHAATQGAHPATVQRPEDTTRAAMEATRGQGVRAQTRAERAEVETARVAAVSEFDRAQQEPVMTDAELGALRADVAAQTQQNARLAGGGQMGALEPLIESDVDIQALDEYPMSEDEVQQLHDDAVARRTHDEANPNVVGEARAEFVPQRYIFT